MIAETNPCAPVDVLIAEDDGDIRLALRELLEREGYRCAEAEDGRVAVEVARLCPPRIVLLDLMMPEMDGFAAARQLRADPQTRDVYIQCVTALNFEAARQAAQEAGCDGYLTKPYDTDELLGVVRVAVSTRGPKGDEFDRAVERLEAALAAKAPGRERDWLKEVGTALTGLEGVLQRQAAQRGAAEGLFCEIDLTRSSLVRLAAELRQTHTDLLGQSRVLWVRVQRAAQAFQASADPAGSAPGMRERRAAGSVVDFTALRQSGLQLLAGIHEHTRAERDLLFETVSTDIGVGD
jgi:CheY-like chemotaxis protein